MFVPPATDKSVWVISQIFGNHWWEALSGGFQSPHFIVTLAGQINALALGALGLMVSYVFVNSAIATAHEGVAMGKRYHSFWVPFRSTYSVLLVTPIPVLKSLCLLQAIVLLFTYYGIGFADSLWTAGINQMSTHAQSAMFQSSANNPVADQSVTGKLFMMALRTEYVKERMAASMGTSVVVPTTLNWQGPKFAWNGPFFISKSNQPFLDAHYTANPAFAVLPPPSAHSKATATGHAQTYSLGEIVIHCAMPKGSTNAASGTCKAQEQAVDAAWKAYLPVAQMIVAELPNQVSSSTVPKPTVQDYRNGVLAYDATLRNGIHQWVFNSGAGHQQFKTDYNHYITDAKRTGWAYAGVYTFQIMRLNNYINNLVHSAPYVKPPSLALSKAMSNLGDWSLAKQYGHDLLTQSSVGVDVLGSGVYRNLNGSSEGTNGYMNYVGHELSRGAGAAISSLRSGINDVSFDVINDTIGSFGTGINTPMTQLQSMGNDMMVLGEVLKVGGDLANLGGSALSSFPIIGSFVGKLGKFVGSSASEFGDAFFGVGAEYGYMIPLVPFAMMLLAFVAWIIYFLEAWIAAPLWAVAHVFPEGEGFAGLRAQAGYMMFFSLLIKPFLIVLGFFMAMILSNVLLRFMTPAFLGFMRILQVNTITGPMATLVILGLFGGLAMAIIYKCYTLVTFIPDKVPSWIAQTLRDLGGLTSPGDVGKVFKGVQSSGMGSLSSQRAVPAGGLLEAHQPVSYEQIGEMQSQHGRGANPSSTSQFDPTDPAQAARAGGPTDEQMEQLAAQAGIADIEDMPQPVETPDEVLNNAPTPDQASRTVEPTDEQMSNMVPPDLDNS